MFGTLLPVTAGTSAAAPTLWHLSDAAGQLQAAGGSRNSAAATPAVGNMGTPLPAAAAAGVRAGAPAAGLLLGIQTPEQAYDFCKAALESVADLSHHLQQQQWYGPTGSSTTMSLFASWLEVARCLELAGRGAFVAVASPTHTAAAAVAASGPTRLVLQLLDLVLLRSGQVLSSRGGW